MQAGGRQRAGRHGILHCRSLHQSLHSGGQQLRDAREDVAGGIQLHRAGRLHPGVLPLGNVGDGGSRGSGVVARR